MLKPLAVVIGDIHFTVPTLELATTALKQAIAKAEELSIPLIMNGDTLDSKAIIRAEVANRLIDLLKSTKIKVIINTGNHDLLHEKSNESSLNFLRPYAEVIDTSKKFQNFTVIPYQNDKENLKNILIEEAEGTILIIHQGVLGADLGHYIKDSTSLPAEEFKDFRVIASHYHKRQDIGTVSYISNPYTLSFGEANDGPKGFAVLMSDGSLQHIPTNLRKHVVSEFLYEELCDSHYPGIKLGDLVWVKIKGTRSQLSKLTKDYISKKMGIDLNYKLELIPIEENKVINSSHKKLRQEDLFDTLIESTEESNEQKKTLKNLWKDILNENGRY